MTDQNVGAARKAFAVLSQLVAYRNGVSLTELVGDLGFAPSTVHRLLRDLVETGFAVQDPLTKLYWVGPEITRISQLRPQDDLLRAVARPHLQALARKTGETVFISVLEGFELLSVDCVLSGQRLQMWGQPGSRGPLHATAQGKAILSSLPPDVRARIVSALPLDRYTPHTIQNAQELLQDLEQTAERGFGINNEERDNGSVSIAAPIVLADGTLIGAMSIGAPLQRLSLEEMIKRYKDDLVTAAQRIADRMTALYAPADGKLSLLSGDGEVSRG
ncbi:IclR family transcriptional regulator [Geodermatophilus sp. SYSU D01186]